MHRTKRVLLSVTAVGAACTLTGTLSSPASAAGGGRRPAPAAVDAPAVTFADPAAGGPLTAGTVAFHGTTSPGHIDQRTTVMYVVDVSGSTSQVKNQDCNSDGVVDAADDYNTDGTVGDILDCEIGAVTALNRGFAALPTDVGELEVGLTAFADTAATASLAPGGGAFTVPSDSTGESRPRLELVADSLLRRHIGKYTSTDLGGGTNFDAAVSTALTALSTVPDGQKWIMLLSDGQATVPPRTLAALTASGVHLRSFAVGSASDCGVSSSLTRLASATGEQCLAASVPAKLTSQVVTAQPAAISSVSLTIGTVTAAADVDPIGNWSARVPVAAGTRTATVHLTATSGLAASATRRFTVAPASITTPNSPDSTPSPTVSLQVARPAPTLGNLAAGVTVRVTATKRGVTSPTNGLQVRLQAQRRGQRTWTTVATRSVRGTTASLRWKPNSRVARLRVALPAQRGLPGAVASVPRPVVSNCVVKKVAAAGHTPAHWLYACRTTARTGSRATLTASGHVLGSTVVRRGSVRISSRSHPRHALLRVVTSPARTVTLQF